MRELIALLALLASASTSARDLPPGPGREEVTRRCVACHETDLIEQQRLSTAGWGREIDKMARWGAVVETAEREAMIAYLAQHYAPSVAASRVSTDGVAEGVFTRACLVCHDADLIEAQRLGRAGWTREVEKMIRWGAAVSDAEKVSLLDYLAGPRMQ